MVHQYKNNGYNIVLDVNSGSVHVVDDMVYDIIALYEKMPLDTIVEELENKYPENDIREAYSEIEQLKEAGQLFTEDIYENYIDAFKDRPTVVKALCLHIAHDCNLACRYCFAEEGEYHGRRALMSFEVGKKALDFLVARTRAATLGYFSSKRSICCRSSAVYSSGRAIMTARSFSARVPGPSRMRCLRAWILVNASSTISSSSASLEG